MMKSNILQLMNENEIWLKQWKESEWNLYPIISMKRMIFRPNETERPIYKFEWSEVNDEILIDKWWMNHFIMIVIEFHPFELNTTELKEEILHGNYFHQNSYNKKFEQNWENLTIIKWF